MAYSLEVKQACRRCFETNKDFNKKQPLLPCSYHEHYVTCNVAREVKCGRPSKWILIRPRPDIRPTVDYQLCTRRKCSHDKRCTFARNELERKAWCNLRADEEPRRLFKRQHQLCKLMISSGICNVSCQFAHSTNELDYWENGVRLAPPIQQYQQYQACWHAVRSRVCPKEDRCRFAHSSVEFNTWNNSKPTVRSAPLLPSGATEYKICKSVNCKRRCLYGHGCKFAHSFHELSEWNLVLQQKSLQSKDFACKVRELTSKFFRSNIKFNHEDTGKIVTIREVCDNPLDLRFSQVPNEVSWEFLIVNHSQESEVMLKSIILFDILSNEFTIQDVYAVYDGHKTQIKIVSEALKGVGCQYDYEMFPNEEIHVKILLRPKVGIQAQLAIFFFSNDFILIRPLSVQVTNRSEESSCINTKICPPPVKKLREYTDDISYMVDQLCEKVDKALPLYSESPKPMSREEIDMLATVSLSEENYRRHMTELLRVEEQQQNDYLDRYGLYDVCLKFSKNCNTSSNGQVYAQEGFYYIHLSLDDMLFEGGRSIKRGDGAFLKSNKSSNVHECQVVHIQRESVILLTTQKAKEDCESSHGICSVEFSLPRIQFRAMIFATKTTDLSIVFPKVLPENIVHHDQLSELTDRCLEDIPKLKLSGEQKQALYGMLNSELKQIPSLVLGPFGCGKTYVMAQCIQLLALHTMKKILVCTHSNSAADHIVRAIVSTSYGELTKPLLRIYFSLRQMNTVSPDILKYCRIKEGRFDIPQLSEIKRYQIIVTTLVQSRVLKLLGVETGHFAFIFIDEAAQTLEAESLIPLTLANKYTKVVLAGDHLQVGPSVYSSDAERLGLRKSLLERLYDHKLYNTEYGQLCKTLLSENYRSHFKILEIPTKLFYQTRLTSKAKFPPDGPKDFPHIGFFGISGQELQDEDSPSYYNNDEASKIIELVRDFVSKGLKQRDICVLATYTKQVKRIRQLLRMDGKQEVTVTRVDGVEGQEFRALFISTVRTCFSEPNLGEQDPLLNNPKFMNTAITRAKEWSIIVGEPLTLCTVGENSHCWLEFIKICHTSNSFWYNGTQLGNDGSEVKYLLENKYISRQIISKLQAASPKINSDGTTEAAAIGCTTTSETRFLKLSPKPKESTLAAIQPTSAAVSSPKLSGKQQPLEQAMKPPLKGVILTGDIIGNGSYGSVEVVKIHKKEYAAKRFNKSFESLLNKKVNKKVMMEYTILCSLKHKNIVAYQGYFYVDNEILPILVMEKLVCNLHQRLCSSVHSIISFPDKLRILLDISEGLCFLHGSIPVVIHRDLSARNVLLDSSGVAKISDFGNSTIINKEQMSTQESMTFTPGTLVYSAPESLMRHTTYDEKRDIFSFGHIALFVFINEFPFDILPNAIEREDGYLQARTEVERRSMYMTKLGEFSEHHGLSTLGYENILSLVEKCFEYKPAKRPTAIEVKKYFENHPCLSKKYNPKIVEASHPSTIDSLDSSSAHIN